MANKREFKKYADALGAAVVNEMVSAYYNVQGADQDKIAQAIEKVMVTITNAKDNANVYFDRGVRAFGSEAEYVKAKRAFFRQLFTKIRTDYTEGMNEALKLYNAALPEAEKARNKEVAAQ